MNMNISCNENKKKNYICSALDFFGRTSEKKTRIGEGALPGSFSHKVPFILCVAWYNCDNLVAIAIAIEWYWVLEVTTVRL